VNRDIVDIFQRSIARRHVYNVTENRWPAAENAPTTEGQFGILFEICAILAKFGVP